MGKIKGTEVTSPLSPQSTDTIFPTHIDIYGRGVMTVKTAAERDAIKCGELLDEDGYSCGRRKYRMPVWVGDEKKWYMLDVAGFEELSDAAKVAALADNANWSAIPAGSDVPDPSTYIQNNLTTPSTTKAPTVDAVNAGLTQLLNPRALQTYNFFGVAFVGLDGDLAAALAFIHINNRDYGVINFYKIYNATSDVAIYFGTILNGNGRFFRMGNWRITMLTGAMVRDLKTEYNQAAHPGAYGGTFYSSYTANTSYTPRLLNCELRTTVTVTANAYIRLTNCDIIGDNWNLGAGTVVLENCREFGTRGTVENGYANVIVIGGGGAEAVSQVQNSLTPPSITLAPSVDVVNEALEQVVNYLLPDYDDVIPPHTMFEVPYDGMICVTQDEPYTLTYATMPDDLIAKKYVVIHRGIAKASRTDNGLVSMTFSDFDRSLYEEWLANSTSTFTITRNFARKALPGTLTTFRMKNNTGIMQFNANSIDVQPRLRRDGTTEDIVVMNTGLDKWTLISDGLGTVVSPQVQNSMFPASTTIAPSVNVVKTELSYKQNKPFNDAAIYGANAGGTDNAYSGAGLTFIGANAGNKNTANNQTMVGVSAGVNTTTGPNNTFVGCYAAQNNTNGQNNVIMGHFAGRLGNGSGNVIIGSVAGQSTTGSNNAFIGFNSGGANTTGTGNVFLGAQSGSVNTTGNNNIAIGNGASPLTAELENTVSLGAGAKAKVSNTMYVSDTLNVGIGVEEPTSKLHVNGVIHTLGGIKYADGSIQTTAGGGDGTGGITSAVLSLDDATRVLTLSTTNGSNFVTLPNYTQNNLTSPSTTLAPSVNAVNTAINAVYVGIDALRTEGLAAFTLNRTPFASLRAALVSQTASSSIVQHVASHILHDTQPLIIGGGIYNLNRNVLTRGSGVLTLAKGTRFGNGYLYNSGDSGSLATSASVPGGSGGIFGEIIIHNLFTCIDMYIGADTYTVLDNVTVYQYTQVYITYAGTLKIQSNCDLGNAILVKEGDGVLIDRRIVASTGEGATGAELTTAAFSNGNLTFGSTNSNYSFNLNSLAAGSIYLVSGATATAHPTYASAYASAVSGDRVVIKRNVTNEHIQLKNGVDIDASGYTLEATSMEADVISDDNIAVVCTVKALKISISASAAGNAFQLLNSQSVVTLEADIYNQTDNPNGTAGVWCTNGTMYVKGNIYVLNQASYGAVCLGESKQNIYGNIITDSSFRGIGAYCLGGTQTVYGTIEVRNKGYIASAHGYDGGTLGFQILNGIRYTSKDLGCRQHYTASTIIFGELNTSASAQPNAWGVDKTSDLGRLELHNCTIITPPGVFSVGSANDARIPGVVHYAGSAPAFSNAPDTLFTFVDISPYRLLGLNTILLVRTNGTIGNFSKYSDAEAAAATGDTLYLSGYFANISVYKSVNLRGTATVETLEIGYNTASLTVNVYDICLTGRVVVCIATNQGTHNVRLESVRTGKFTYFEQYGLNTEGGISNILVKNVVMRSERAHRPLDGTAAIGGGILGFQERGNNGYGMWTFEDCVLESVYTSIVTGYKGNFSRVTFTGTTRLATATGKPIHEAFEVNTTTAMPDALVLVDNRTNVNVLHQFDTTVKFDNNAEYSTITSGTFLTDTSRKVIGAVVYVYLRFGTTAPSLSSEFINTGTQAYAANENLMYTFRVSATGFILYTITVLQIPAAA